MLRFVGRRILFMVLVWIFIVFFAHLGMRMARKVVPLLTLTILGISIPSFFAGLLLRVGELRYLAFTGRRLVSMAGFGWDFEHMLMPVLVLAARPLADLTRSAFLIYEVGLPTLLVTWQGASEDNWPAEIADEVDLHRLGVAGRMVTLALVSVAR